MQRHFSMTLRSTLLAALLVALATTLSARDKAATTQSAAAGRTLPVSDIFVTAHGGRRILLVAGATAGFSTMRLARRSNNCSVASRLRPELA